VPIVSAVRSGQARLEVVVEDEGDDRDDQAEGGGDQRLRDAARDDRVALPMIDMLWKARTMPITVPNRPMKGALAATVPRTQRALQALDLLEAARCSSDRGGRRRPIALRSRSVKVRPAGVRLAGALERGAHVRRLTSTATRASGAVWRHAIRQQPRADDREADNRHQDQRIRRHPALLDHLQHVHAFHAGCSFCQTDERHRLFIDAT
jgi:hypothetical protein